MKGFYQYVAPWQFHLEVFLSSIAFLCHKACVCYTCVVWIMFKGGCYLMHRYYIQGNMVTLLHSNLFTRASEPVLQVPDQACLFTITQ